MGEYHRPIMTEQVVAFLKPPRDGVMVDCTVGGGGHAEAILDAYPGVKLIGMDRDEDAVVKAKERLQRFGQRQRIIHSDYRCLHRMLTELGVETLVGLLFDLGVSSHQLDRPERGFSYWQSGPLDMRMDVGQTTTAADILNHSQEDEIERILRIYGEERWARRIARFIVKARRTKPLQSTDELVDVVKAAIPAAARRDGPHPARRTFQALRMAVNTELDGLKKVLNEGIDWLRPGARICVLAFHSLEDRIVKQVYRERAGQCQCPPDIPACVCGAVRHIRVLTARPCRADAKEQEENPRSRSAKLRAAERVEN